MSSGEALMSENTSLASRDPLCADHEDGVICKVNYCKWNPLMALQRLHFASQVLRDRAAHDQPSWLEF